MNSLAALLYLFSDELPTPFHNEITSLAIRLFTLLPKLTRLTPDTRALHELQALQTALQTQHPIPAPHNSSTFKDNLCLAHLQRMTQMIAHYSHLT